ncbi:hypothetical protein CA600_22750 [Paenibacillus sp. VTT E-133280]|uniref:hypothetical protein n=1 Tax=unclassified Paenibacillus TaxID=185978 RepID=UPI000BA18CFF|nr:MULTISPECIES: hypothetical protein [unclassified Paenibacillus]MBY3621317.1 hypothetical protein [Acinetobacter sp. CUI P1]MDH6373083.1 hypothetical protein [Paenibacillus sp. PastF-3]OZQ62253.1 hypothetical protein CA600_22750 [Paenibacillus sp. VTT E-133280]OZQ77752.1 hypothetical protein CA598_29610 [Paenibacillus sp. VTT E-133291]
MASAARHLLDQITKIPGTDENGKIDAVALDKWISEVRRLCRQFARAESGDQSIGQLLSKTPVGENGLWPCEVVCEAMESIVSSGIEKGFHKGVINSRDA